MTHYEIQAQREALLRENKIRFKQLNIQFEVHKHEIRRMRDVALQRERNYCDAYLAAKYDERRHIKSDIVAARRAEDATAIAAALAQLAENGEVIAAIRQAHMERVNGIEMDFLNKERGYAMQKVEELDKLASELTIKLKELDEMRAEGGEAL